MCMQVRDYFFWAQLLVASALQVLALSICYEYRSTKENRVLALSHGELEHNSGQGGDDEAPPFTPGTDFFVNLILLRLH